MPRIFIENSVCSKSIIEFGISHRDVAGVLNCSYHNIKIMAKYSQKERLVHNNNLNITTFLEYSLCFVIMSTSGMHRRFPPLHYSAMLRYVP